MGNAGRCAFTAALESMADCRQVLLVSSVPLVHVHLTLLEHSSAACQATRDGRTT